MTKSADIRAGKNALCSITGNMGHRVPVWQRVRQLRTDGCLGSSLDSFEEPGHESARYTRIAFFEKILSSAASSYLASMSLRSVPNNLAAGQPNLMSTG